MDYIKKINLNGRQLVIRDQELYESLMSAIDRITELEDDELAIAAALNDLNDRVLLKLDTETYETDVTTFVTDAEYVSIGSYHAIVFKNRLGDELATIDASNFIKDGMVQTVSIDNGNLIITFNTESDKQPISIPLTDIFDPDNYYTKAQVDTKLAEKVDKVTGKDLSTNDYTTAEKNKLAGIAEGAEVNVQSNWNETDNTSDSYIQNKPRFSEVAISGSYNDLSDTPDIDTMSKNIEDNEIVISAALNDLNDRIIALTNTINLLVLPNPTELTDGTTLVVQNGKWVAVNS